MEYIILFMLFFLWISFWSFWSVLVRRLSWKVDRKKIEWILYWRSNCTNCGYVLWVMDLIPIISYLTLWWKCRSCWKKISWFYPAIELFSWIIFLLSYFFVKSYVWDIYSLEFVINLFFVIMFNRFLVMFIIWDILFYELNVYLWISILLMTVFLQFFWPLWDFSEAFVWAIAFFSFFYFIYWFWRLYVRFRFWLKNTEWFWLWDVMIWLLIWLFMPFIYVYNNIWPSDLLYFILSYIVISSLLWLVFAVLWLVFSKWWQWKSIPFLPAMILWFWIMMFFSGKIISIISGF